MPWKLEIWTSGCEYPVALLNNATLTFSSAIALPFRSESKNWGYLFFQLLMVHSVTWKCSAISLSIHPSSARISASDSYLSLYLDFRPGLPLLRDFFLGSLICHISLSATKIVVPLLLYIHQKLIFQVFFKSSYKVFNLKEINLFVILCFFSLLVLFYSSINYTP